MQTLLIRPSQLSGHLKVPPSKSHTHRAILFSLLGSGISHVRNFLSSPDSEAMLQAISQMGAEIEQEKDVLKIKGGLCPAQNVIDAKNSGLVLRLIAAIGALLPTYTLITGDESIRQRRPIEPLLAALKQLGALADTALGNGFAPLIIKGPIHPGKCCLSGEDSQPVSALLIATSFLDGPSEIFVENPGEKPWIDLTLAWVRRLGGVIEHQNYTHYRVKGGLVYSGFDYTVPADFSTAAFPLGAALLTRSALTLHGLDPQDVQGDKVLIEILQKMGAKISWLGNRLVIEPTEHLVGQSIDLDSCIDALPILAVIGCFAKGTTTLYNGAIARKKESDRIATMAYELKKMGAHIEERPDGLIIQESSLKGAPLFAHQDHRVALSLSVAALSAKGSSVLSGTEGIAKTYPTFIEDFKQIGASIELDSIRV